MFWDGVQETLTRNWSEQSCTHLQRLVMAKRKENKQNWQNGQNSKTTTTHQTQQTWSISRQKEQDLSAERRQQTVPRRPIDWRLLGQFHVTHGSQSNTERPPAAAPSPANTGLHLCTLCQTATRNSHTRQRSISWLKTQEYLDKASYSRADQSRTHKR